MSEIKFKAHFKLEFDIKTNSGNMQQILETIVDTVSKEFNANIKDQTEIEVMPTVTMIQVPCYGKTFEDNDGNTYCSRCGDKVEGGYCGCYKREDLICKI